MRFRVVMILWEASWSCHKVDSAICFSRASNSRRFWGASKKAPDVGSALLQSIKFTLQFFDHDSSLIVLTTFVFMNIVVFSV